MKKLLILLLFSISCASTQPTTKIELRMQPIQFEEHYTYVPISFQPLNLESSSYKKNSVSIIVPHTLTSPFPVKTQIPIYVLNEPIRSNIDDTMFEDLTIYNYIFMYQANHLKGIIVQLSTSESLVGWPVFGDTVNYIKLMDLTIEDRDLYNVPIYITSELLTPSKEN